MTVSRKVDQRLNPEIATKAAARLLRDNYNALGSWPLAITAYQPWTRGDDAGPERNRDFGDYEDHR
jgi:membrane-bound lytic murein transglycosylase D